MIDVRNKLSNTFLTSPPQNEADLTINKCSCVTFLLLFVMCDFFTFVLRMKALQLVTFGRKLQYSEHGQQNFT